MCPARNSVASHPTCSPHPPSSYIKLNGRGTSGEAEVGYIFRPTQRWWWGPGRFLDVWGFFFFPFLLFYGNASPVILKDLFDVYLKITGIWRLKKKAHSWNFWSSIFRDASKWLACFCYCSPEWLQMIGPAQVEVKAAELHGSGLNSPNSLPSQKVDCQFHCDSAE